MVLSFQRPTKLVQKTSPVEPTDPFFPVRSSVLHLPYHCYTKPNLDSKPNTLEVIRCATHFPVGCATHSRCRVDWLVRTERVRNPVLAALQPVGQEQLRW